MRAVILAGGKGTRLKPYTITLPKPLVPVKEKAILEYVLNQLKRDGFDHVTIAVNHMADLIMAYFGDGKKWGIKIDYSLEEKPLSTIGPLTLIDNLPDNFLVMNGDLLTDIKYDNLFNFHILNRNDVTVAVYKRKQKIDFGVIDFDMSGKIINFIEKPEYNFTVSMGIYIISKEVITSIPKNEFYGFDNLMIDGIKNKLKMSVYEHDGFWLDIGRPDDYETANKQVTEFGL